MSSQELTKSCQALAASDRSSIPGLTYDIAKTLVGSAVSTCVVPKAGADGLARLDLAPAEKTGAAGWADAVCTDRPLPSGFVISTSWDVYAFVNDDWLLARAAGSSS